MTRRERLDALTHINCDDLARAFRLPANRVTRVLLRPPAKRFAHQVQRLDDLVAAQGLAAGARWALRTFTRGVTTVGREREPAQGPLLAVSNHPGLTDAMALVLALEARMDLMIVALDRPFLRAVPSIADRLLWVADGNRFELIHRARDHLRAGGALLTFPAGTIEPDPSLRSALEALTNWSPSVAALTRGIPEMQVVPLAVSGVISGTALTSPAARWIADPRDREYAAATLQVLFRRYRDTDTRVLVGTPFEPGRDVAGSVQKRMAELLGEVPFISADCSRPNCCSRGGATATGSVSNTRH